MNEYTIGSGDRASLSMGTSLGKHEGLLYGDFKEKVRFCFYQGICGRRLWNLASLSIWNPLGNLEWDHLPWTLRDR
jgi:hypothetical protein